MSYHIWPVTGYGLIYQRSEELKDITKLYHENDDDFSEYDLMDIGANVVDEECDSKFSVDLNNENEKDDPWIWFSCKKAVSPLRQAYASWQEMANEFVDEYSETLKLPPVDNKDWWLKHLGYIEYTQGG